MTAPAVIIVGPILSVVKGKGSLLAMEMLDPIDVLFEDGISSGNSSRVGLGVKLFASKAQGVTLVEPTVVVLGLAVKGTGSGLVMAALVIVILCDDISTILKEVAVLPAELFCLGPVVAIASGSFSDSDFSCPPFSAKTTTTMTRPATTNPSIAAIVTAIGLRGAASKSLLTGVDPANVTMVLIRCRSH